MKIRPVGADLFHADKRTYDEANSSFFFVAILRTRLKATNGNPLHWHS